MIKLIHTADLHLDSPFAMLDPTRSEQRRHELKGSFGELMSLAKRTQADIMVIAGDLFDGAYVTRDTLEMLVRGFASVPDCRIVISPGNHDNTGASVAYERLSSLDNVYIFKSEELSHIDFPELECTVYGYAFTSSYMEKSPLCGFTAEDPTRINILAAHADITSPVSRYAPITQSDLMHARFDYAALGHIHAYDGVHEICGGYYAYSGCLEGRGFDELGEKGALLLTLSKEDGRLTLESEFLPVSKRIYVDDTLDITGVGSSAEILSRVRTHIDEHGYDDRHAVKLVLKGFLPPALRVFPRYLEGELGGVFMIKIKDDTLPLYESESLGENPSIKGAYYEKLRPLLESGDSETRELAAMALRYGLIALAGGEPSDLN